MLQINKISKLIIQLIKLSQKSIGKNHHIIIVKENSSITYGQANLN